MAFGSEDKNYRRMFNFILLAGMLLVAIPLVFFLFTDFREFLKLIANFGTLMVIGIAAVEILVYEAKKGL